MTSKFILLFFIIKEIEFIMQISVMLLEFSYNKRLLYHISFRQTRQELGK